MLRYWDGTYWTLFPPLIWTVLHAVDIDLDSKGSPWQPVHGLISIRRLIFQHWRLYDRTPD
ncbi:MAG: hypothetical protein B7X12_06635 [Halothiobacillus sp. 20-53-49]|nr:MAG: hypothetical protein B7X12_06635 [Halothiobacillus sp. 20-53-49]